MANRLLGRQDGSMQAIDILRGQIGRIDLAGCQRRA